MKSEERKEIDREYARLICLAFPEKLQMIRRKSWLKHLAENRRKAREKRAADPLRGERYLAWKTKNPDKVAGWIRNNRARLANYRARARARATGVAISDSPRVLEIYQRAEELRAWFDVLVDHVVSFSKGGAHSPENMQIIYVSENRSKHARSNYVPSVIFT